MDMGRCASVASKHWQGVLSIGVALWLLGLVAVGISHDVLLVPAVLLLGGLVAPMTMAAWALERDSSRSLSTGRLVFTATAGASLSFFATGVVGSALATRGLLAAPLRAGIVEELAKTLVVAAVAAGMGRRRARDGILLGTAVGLGFTTLENAGYALRAFALASSNTGELLLNQLTRNLQAPLTHALWSAIAGGFLLMAAGSLKARWIRWAIAVAGLAIAATMHAYWDAANALSLRVVTVLGVRSLHLLAAVGSASGSGRQVAWDVVWVLMIMVSSALGLRLLGALWSADASVWAAAADQAPVESSMPSARQRVAVRTPAASGRKRQLRGGAQHVAPGILGRAPGAMTRAEIL